jgi:nicotinate phosphoribosyltransferase
VDLLQSADEAPPEVGARILVRHPFAENKRAFVSPTKVLPLLHVVYDCGKVRPPSSLAEARDRCRAQLNGLRNDHVRALNPTPYKISVSQKLYDHMHDLWMKELPVKELV